MKFCGNSLVTCLIGWVGLYVLRAKYVSNCYQPSLNCSDMTVLIWPLKYCEYTTKLCLHCYGVVRKWTCLKGIAEANLLLYIQLQDGDDAWLDAFATVYSKHGISVPPRLKCLNWSVVVYINTLKNALADSVVQECGWGLCAQSCSGLWFMLLHNYSSVLYVFVCVVVIASLCGICEIL